MCVEWSHHQRIARKATPGTIEVPQRCWQSNRGTRLRCTACKIRTSPAELPLRKLQVSELTKELRSCTRVDTPEGVPKASPQASPSGLPGSPASTLALVESALRVRQTADPFELDRCFTAIDADVGIATLARDVVLRLQIRQRVAIHGELVARHEIRDGRFGRPHPLSGSSTCCQRHR